MEAEFKAIIEKQLPAQVGKVLQERLAKADQDEKSLKEYINLCEQRYQTIQDQERKIKEYQAFDSRNAGLEAREKAVADAERNLKVKELEYQLNTEKEKSSFCMDVTRTLVKNVEYKKSIMDSDWVSAHSRDGKWVDAHTETKTFTETKTAE
jgi:hypothetical protein